MPVSTFAQQTRKQSLLYRINDVLLRRVAGFLAGITLAAALVVMGLQVVGRYVFNHSFIWGEELTRYLIIWSAMFGGATAHHMGAHTAMTYLVERSRSRLARLALMVGQLAMLAFLLFTAWQGEIGRAHV